ncbi:MAG: TrkA family potassium uptake protein [Myxococcales bacterium]|nr:TrkA family potassium uptake protein [Myxococcales bacterium]MCB9531122.1 TrkA family potassium uptake protein [Myxococcales bacterium]MCB9534287.1 TrkA family potassium uptake protein [Myxococcales bacterium]
MKRQILVIGLGQFGMALARAVSDRGHEVLAVDRNAERVQEASTFVDQAVALDATDEHALARLAPERRDVVVSAIGDEGREAAIIVTALCRQMGARHVVARATDSVMERILTLVGAHEVVNPEKAYGQRLAGRLLFTGVIEETPLGPGLAVAEFVAPGAIVGRSLAQLELPRRFAVTVVAVRRQNETGADVIMPDAATFVAAGDVLVVVGKAGAAQELVERLG